MPRSGMPGHFFPLGEAILIGGGFSLHVRIHAELRREARALLFDSFLRWITFREVVMKRQFANVRGERLSGSRGLA